MPISSALNTVMSPHGAGTAGRTMPRGLRALLFPLTAAFLTAAMANGAQVTGVVKDGDGRPLPQATVSVVDMARGVERETSTAADGAYAIDELPGADLLVRVSRLGLQTRFTTLAKVGVDETRRCDAALGPARVVRLENRQVSFSIDESGAATELRNKAINPGRNYIQTPAPGFWRLIFRRGTSWENEVSAGWQEQRIEKSAPDALRVTVDKLRCRHELLPVRLVFDIRLKNEEVVWTAEIDNRSDVEITEFYFPELGEIRSLGDPAGKDYLYWPNGAGERIAGFASRTLRLTHPFWGSMGWYTINNGREGLYFGTHDDAFTSGELQVGVNAEQGGRSTCGFAKFPFVRPGAKWRSKPYVVAPYQGTWHKAADKYRVWMQTWRKVRDKPQWVRRMNGMFLVILNQQYGDAMWHYDDLPYLYREAQANGINTLALFGWTEAGHDNQYPDYHAGPQLGGAESLRAGLKRVAEAGGHTILYLNGRLMDAEGLYAKSPEGQRVATRNLWGNPYVEQYNKFSHSSLLRNYSRKLQYIANPIHPEWRRTILGQGLDVAAHGPSGLIFDQLGGMYAFPAFDAGAANPGTVVAEGQQRLLAELRAGLKRENPEHGLMVELLTDVYTQYADVIHGCGAAFAPGGNAFPALSRYVLSDLIITARNPMPRIDSQRANFALAYGFCQEVEVRYRDDAHVIRNHVQAERAAYVRKVSQLRSRYWDVLGGGRFVDVLGVESSNAAVTTTAFENGEQRAVVAWNDTAKPQSIVIKSPNCRLIEVAGVDGLLTARPLKLEPQQVAVWLFERAK